MVKILLIIAAFIALSVALARFLEAWLNESEKERLTSKLEELWVKIEDSSPISIAQFPLGMLEIFYNAIFGERIFSKKAYLRSSIISAIILICILSISGLYTGNTLSIKTPPWKLWDHFSVEKYEQLFKAENGVLTKDLTESQKESYNIIFKFLSSTGWKIGHGMFFVIATLGLNAFFDATSLSITRLMLREAQLTNSIIIYSCILFTNLLVAFLLSTLSIILVMICYAPMAGVLFRVGLALSVEHPAWTIIGAFAIIVGIWNLSGVWLRIIAFTTVLPILLLCCLIVLYILLYPLRFKIHSFSSKLLFNALKYEKGILAFCIIALGLLGSIIGFIGLILKSFT